MTQGMYDNCNAARKSKASETHFLYKVFTEKWPNMEKFFNLRSEVKIYCVRLEASANAAVV